MNQMSFVGQQPPPLPPVPVSFTGERRKFFRLLARGAALELVTVGFYRFWLATDIRRHLWSHTEIDGDAAEYTGRGKELLLGFLFALAILVPIYLAYLLVSIEVERVQGFGSFPLLLAFYAFGQFAIYRARRYRLTRTIWRGVRFWMDGSGWAYAGRALLWGCLVILTLGLALPWREAALERYKMQHSHYGDLQGSFEGQGWEFFKRAWWLWLCAPFAMVLFPLAPFLYAEFKAVEWRWWLSGIRFGGVRLESTLPRRALRPLLENDRLVRAVLRGLGRVFGLLLLYVLQDQRRDEDSSCYVGHDYRELTDSDHGGARLSRNDSFAQCDHAALSVARCLGEGRGVGPGAWHRGGGECRGKGRSGERAG